MPTLVASDWTAPHSLHPLNSTVSHSSQQRKRERDRQTDRQTDRQRESVCVCVLSTTAGLPNTDMYYAPICHEAVQKVLEKFGTAEGNFLVRQSRSHDCSFVLSLCHNSRVLNFRSASTTYSIHIIIF